MGEAKAEFDGAGLESADVPRLESQLKSVWLVMRDGKWRTLQQIAELVDAPTHSIGSRVRDLRKEKFGGHVVATANLGGGLVVYRVVPKQELSETVGGCHT